MLQTETYLFSSYTYISFVFPNDSLIQHFLHLEFIWNSDFMQEIAYNLTLCFVMNFNFIELAINVYLELPKL